MADQALLQRASILSVRRFIALYQKFPQDDDNDSSAGANSPPAVEVPPVRKRHRRTPGEILATVAARPKKRTLYPGVSEALRESAFAACSEFIYCNGPGPNNPYIPLSIVRDAFVSLCERADLPSARTGLFSWRGETVRFDIILQRAIEFGERGIAVLLRASTPQSNSVVMRWAPPNNRASTLAVVDPVSTALRRTVACNYSYSTEHEIIFITHTDDQTQTICTLPANEPFFSAKTLSMLDKL
jgi:hypothetical protein